MKRDRNKHRVVIIGGGFGGLNAARKLKDKNIEIVLIDRKNYHLFQPLLYQVATAGLSPADIATPLRFIFRRRKDVHVIMGEVECFNPRKKKVILKDAEIHYDSLIVAAGSTHHYFGNSEWAKYAPGLKTIEDATHIRSRIFRAFEAAERETNHDRVRQLLTFVIVGAGPTGVEMAGALSEIARDTLKHDFRNINPADSRVILAEGLDRVLPAYPEKLSNKAHKALKDLGVEVRLKTFVTNIENGKLTVKVGDEEQTIESNTIIWAAGVKASPLGKDLASNIEIELDKPGMIPVQPDLSLKEYPEIFVIGDLAKFEHNREQPLPGVAQVAIQQGKYVAKLIKKRLKGKEYKPFKYHDRGDMSTIGRTKAVADLHWIKLSGFPAWIIWLFVHLMYIVGFQNRLLVFIQWAYNYLTQNRSARIITGEQSDPKMVESGFDKISANLQRIRELEHAENRDQ